MFRYSAVLLLALFTSNVIAECDPDFDDCDAETEVVKSPEQLAKEKALAELIKKPFVFAEVRKVDLTKEEIITNTAVFIAQKFVSSKSVIDVNSPTQGKLAGNIILKDPDAGWLDIYKYISLQLIVEAKNGRFRMQAKNVHGLLNDFGRPPEHMSGIEGRNADVLKPKTYKLLNKLLSELNSHLLKTKANSKW